MSQLFMVFLVTLSINIIPTLTQAEPLAQNGKRDLHDQEEEIFIVNSYRFVPEGTGQDNDTGQALCGTRCNAISSDYLNYIKPGGWRLIQIAENHEMEVNLKNPFMDGKCVCIANKYKVLINDLYMAK